MIGCADTHPVGPYPMGGGKINSSESPPSNIKVSLYSHTLGGDDSPGGAAVLCHSNFLPQHLQYLSFSFSSVENNPKPDAINPRPLTIKHVINITSQLIVGNTSVCDAHQLCDCSTTGGVNSSQNIITAPPMNSDMPIATFVKLIVIAPSHPLLPWWGFFMVQHLPAAVGAE
jgi:hypothetical protein